MADIFGTTDVTGYSDYFKVYPDGTSSDEQESDIVWSEDGSFSFTLSGDLAANIIAAKGLPIFGVHYTVTINGVYCGLKSSYGLFVLNS